MCKERLATKHPGRDTHYFSERITRIFSLLRPAQQLIPRREVQRRKSLLSGCLDVSPQSRTSQGNAWGVNCVTHVGS